MRYLPVVLAIGLTVYAVIDCARTPEEEVQHLPKPLWLLIVLLAWVVGPIAWLLAGRRRDATPFRGQPGPRGPDDDPDFLRSIGDHSTLRRDDEARRDDQVRKDDENEDRPG